MTTETVIRGSRAKAAVLLLGGVAFTALCVSMLRAPDADRLWLWLGVALFGAGSLVAAWLVVRPAELRLRPHGFMYRSLGKTLEVPWDDVESFHVWKNPRAFQSLAAWTYMPGKRPDGILARASAGLGADGAIPGMLTMPPQQIVALMNHHLELRRR